MKHHNITPTAVLACKSLDVNANRISSSASTFKARPTITQQHHNVPAKEQ